MLIINKHHSLNVNHFLTFIPVYANGMLAAWFYISYTKNSDAFFEVSEENKIDIHPNFRTILLVI